MSFAGHVMDMISRYQHNRAMVKKRPRLKDIHALYKPHSREEHSALTTRPLTDEQIMRIQAEAGKWRKANRINLFLAGIVALAITAVLVFLLIKAVLLIGN